MSVALDVLATATDASDGLADALATVTGEMFAATDALGTVTGANAEAGRAPVLSSVNASGLKVCAPATAEAQASDMKNKLFTGFRF